MIVTQSEAMSPRAKRKRNGGQAGLLETTVDAAAHAAERFARGPFDKLRVTFS
jgi:hypothetical protein